MSGTGNGEACPANKQAAPDMNRHLAEATSRVQKRVQEQAKLMAEFLASQPASVLCGYHPDVTLRLSQDHTRRRTCDNGGRLTAGYEPCPRCQAQREEQAVQERLHRQGVPLNLLACTLDNWQPANEHDETHLSVVRKYVSLRKGFLVHLGDLGTGKTHLAVGVMRYESSAFFVTQADLLDMLRLIYRDRTSQDPVERCRRVALLVLDEMGLSAGGRDELPLLHRILDYRHGEQKPTILTGNLSWVELTKVIGERLADRLKESAAKILIFGGYSHRPEARKRYFGNGEA